MEERDVAGLDLHIDRLLEASIEDLLMHIGFMKSDMETLFAEQELRGAETMQWMIEMAELAVDVHEIINNYS